MKFLIAFLVIAVMLIFEPIYSAKVCVIRVNNCTSNVTVCGRYGRSKLCKRFSNQCALDAANCGSGAGYTAVNATRCSGIALNRRRRCNGVSSSFSSILGGGLFGGGLFGGSSSSNIRPIVINTGK